MPRRFLSTVLPFEFHHQITELYYEAVFHYHQQKLIGISFRADCANK
jgi:hypothetical protein